MADIKQLLFGRQDLESIDPAEQPRAMNDAIKSACFGGIAQLLLSDSGVIILYATQLHSSNFVSLCTTSLQDLSICLFLLPIAFLTQRFGIKRIILPSMFVGMLAYLAAACAAWAGAFAEFTLLASLTVFSVAGGTIYVAGWFPLLKDVVPDNQRGRFFGRMRVSWQITALVFIVVTSLLVGKQASTGMLQAIIAVAGLLTLGRIWYIRRLPEKKSETTRDGFRNCLVQIFKDSKLVGFGVYSMWLYLFAGATVPLVIMFCKFQLKVLDSTVVMLTFFCMGGYILGYFLAGRLVDKFGTKSIFLVSHFSFGALNLALLSAHRGTPATIAFIFAIVGLYGVVMAAASVALSSETFALAPARNKNIAIAFCVSMYSVGIGLSRFLSAWILSSGILAESWRWFGMEFTRYHSMFLLFGLGVIAAVVLLSLVPAVVRKLDIIPGN